jgi:hypothetical protein
MTDAEIVEQLLANGISDETRNIADEMTDALKAAFDAGKEPDDHTKLATAAIYVLARNIMEGMYALDLAEISDEDGNRVEFKDGDLPDAIDQRLKAGAVVMALARDEEKHTPRDMAAALFKSIFDSDVRNHYAKLALDNIRKGNHLA